MPRGPLLGLRSLRLPRDPLRGFGIPIVFVLIWSTGFIVAKAVAPHADLQLYLVARLCLTALLMAAAAALIGAKWPRGRGVWPHLLAGAWMQGVYLAPKLLRTGPGALAPLTVAAALVSVMAVTAGALVQKWLAATSA